MFDFNSAPLALTHDSALDPKIFPATVNAARAWLETEPHADIILANLPALELALAGYVKNQDPTSLALTRAAAQRVNAAAQENLSLDTLAARLVLNTHLFQITRDALFQTAAQRLTAQSRARFDAERGFFANATDDANVFCTDVNAQLAEALYCAWRVWGDQPSREMAGDVLGQVGAAFQAPVGLAQRVALADDMKTDTRHLPAYAAVMQMYLTATETTGRATYVARARIVGNYARANLWDDALGAPRAPRAQLADAFTRLAQFTSADAYRAAAHALLHDASAVAQDIGAARYALAVEHATQFPLHLVILGNADHDETAREMWNVAWNTFGSARAIEILDPQQHTARLETLGYSAADPETRAYVCRGPICFPPVRSAEQLRAMVETGEMEGWSDGVME